MSDALELTLDFDEEFWAGPVPEPDVAPSTPATELDITHDFDGSYYEGVGSAVLVPYKYDVALNGRGYMLDTNHPAFGGQSAYLGRMGIETIPLIRQQADSATEPGESTINPEDLWPRAQSSWHKGAGQKYLDAPDSDRQRFRASFGLDPWTRGQLNMLHDTGLVSASTNVNLSLVRVGAYIYYANGNDLKFSTTPSGSYTSADIQASETAQSIRSVTSDGYNVWAALGTNGIHATTRAATSSSHYNALAATLVSYVKGRLMAAKANMIYNVTAGGAAPSPLFSHPNTDFTWVGFAEGQGQIYAAGYSGDKSLIYRTAVKADGTALDAPVVAAELPDGEIVRSVQGYLGTVVIGTEIGFRLAQQNTNGDLIIGALVETNTAIRCFEPQGRFVWFGWEDYDSSYTGLGRIDLTIDVDAGAPAYASDLMALSQGQVSSVITEPGGTRMFCVQGAGLYKETSDNVASATFDSGLLSFGIPDDKIALRLQLKHKALTSGDVLTCYVNPDEKAQTFVGRSDIVGAVTSLPTPLRVPELVAQLFEIHFVLEGDVTLESYGFRAYPASERGFSILVPILLHEKVVTHNGAEESLDVLAEYKAIRSLVGADRLVVYQELGMTDSVFIEDAAFQRHHAVKDRSFWNGTLLAKLKALGD